MAEDAFDPEVLRDIFAKAGSIVIKRMFGGQGLYADGLIFGLIISGTLYLRVDEQTSPDFEAEDLPFFVYSYPPPTTRKPVTMPYRQIPERCFDDPDEAAVWARKAVSAAGRAAATKMNKPLSKQKKKLKT
jgi:DNA transformation protein